VSPATNIISTLPSGDQVAKFTVTGSLRI
jgi:hypothetical protein